MTQKIAVLDGNPWMIAEKGGSRIIHKVGNRYCLQVAVETWHNVLMLSKESGLASIKKLKGIKPFNNEAWKFELVRQSDFELAAPMGGAQSWFRIKKS